MPRKKPDEAVIEAWTIDQFAKSAFFHRKLHEWKLLEVADEIDRIRGEDLKWEGLKISEQAWNRIIHRGIKPVVVFAHPIVLRTVPGSAGYYRQLSMASQKSMKRIGINLDSYEMGGPILDEQIAVMIARHLNRITSTLIEADTEINPREFDLWRGMAAGSQAQGSWQNNKGAVIEVAIREIILRRLQEQHFVSGEIASKTKIDLAHSRVLVFADEPDIAIYANDTLQVAVEVKGGIDQAGVLERLGATLKSLQRARQENPDSVTVLILHGISLTEQAKKDLVISAGIVNHWFSISAILEDEYERGRFFKILGI